MTAAPNLEELDAEQDATTTTATAEAAPVAPAPRPRRNRLLEAITSQESFTATTEHLLAHLCAFRRYEAERHCDTVGGARRRIQAIEHELSAEAPYLPLERVRELQGELARLATVSEATEVEVKRSIRARAEVVHAQFKAWAELVLFYAEKILAERRQRVADFAAEFGMDPFPTPVTAQVEELIRTVSGFLRAAVDEVEQRPRCVNEGDVKRIGAMPIFVAPQPNFTPGIATAISTLQVFNVNTDAVFTAAEVRD